MKLDDAFTTGSSIMPHKKNPDVFELVRAKCSIISQLPGVLAGAFGYLPSGYHRDLQLLKDQVFPAIHELKSCLEIVTLALQHITIKDHLLEDEKYRLTFSVEVVNQLVNEGMPFREAYQKIAQDIANNTFEAPNKIHHTHEGSIGNLCLEQIKAKFSAVENTFDFSYEQQMEALIS